MPHITNNKIRKKEIKLKPKHVSKEI